MSNDTQLNDLAYQLENLQTNVSFLADAINKTDDFNGWTVADSSASIANALVKANTLEKAKQKAKEKAKFQKERAKMRREFMKAADLLGITIGEYKLKFTGEDGDACLLTSLIENRGFTDAQARGWVDAFSSLRE